MENLSIAQVLIQSLLLLLTSGITFIFTKRKYNAESKGVEINNIESSLKVYVNIIEDLETRVEKLQGKIGELEIMIDNLKTENKTLKEQSQKVCKFPDKPKCE